jgi:hypothetical protein
MMLLDLAAIACGNYSRHHFVARRQKARFLPAAYRDIRFYRRQCGG